MDSLTLREHQQKTVNSLKKEIFHGNPFSDNAEWSSKKLWKMISTDEIANVN